MPSRIVCDDAVITDKPVSRSDNPETFEFVANHLFHNVSLKLSEAQHYFHVKFGSDDLEEYRRTLLFLSHPPFTDCTIKTSSLDLYHCRFVFEFLLPLKHFSQFNGSTKSECIDGALNVLGPAVIFSCKVVYSLHGITKDYIVTRKVMAALLLQLQFCENTKCSVRS
jgi:hypothetical protein